VLSIKIIANEENIDAQGAKFLAAAISEMR
jgi:hypothetical protein